MRPAIEAATYQDVIDAPAHMVAELLSGELFLQPRPAMRHGQAASTLGMLLGTPFQLGRGGPGGWFIQDEPEIHFADHVLVPDLAGWRRDEGSDLDLTKAFATVPPNWVCEVLSPSTQGVDRVRKLPIYAEHGVGHVWLVDPINRTLEVFQLQEGRWTLIGTYEAAAEIQSEPFEAISFDLSLLWVDED